MGEPRTGSWAELEQQRDRALRRSANDTRVRHGVWWLNSIALQETFVLCSGDLSSSPLERLRGTINQSWHETEHT